MRTFKNIKEHKEVFENYCVHAQVAFMLVNEDELESKYNEKIETIEVMSDKPYYAIAHAGKAPAIIHFPRQTKSANCTAHPGSHKAGKSRCEHLVAHEEKHKAENETEDHQNLKAVTRMKPSEIVCEDKRIDNPYNIRINFIPTEEEQAKYRDTNYKFPENLVLQPTNRYCEKHGNKYCSSQSAIDRYLIMSDKVNIHDLLQVDDSRNTVCRAFYLDTTSPGSNEASCDCRLPYSGQDDLLLPISRVGEKTTWNGRGTYNVVSYRMLFDLFLLEMTDGCSASGYISAFNKRRRLLCGSSAKECPKKVWLEAVGDFESALTTDESKAFTCDKCPSENSPGDGLDEVHIGDGVCEGMQVSLVPKDIQTYKEPISGKKKN